ncbi:MAG: bifunctional oligoribonuclease/PAP phosphatase NrnA [Ruminococcaceae bacterium]|jgi:phosphoesterase RecJ-like protein|nr:bifunctional oligoribonuclease/PAP phosphatase NrnA [Oscillospiraceae bacterium]
MMEVSLIEAATWLLQQQDIGILCHQSPDGDTLGSGSALCRALRSLGKRAQVLCSDPIGKRFAFLFEGLEEQQFEPKAIVAVDVADEQLLGSLQPVYGGKIQLCIDHHPSNTHYAERWFVNPQASAACEVMYSLIPLLGVKIDIAIASDLYTGIATDTGCFQYINVTPRTFRIAAELLELGVPAPKINHAMFATKSRERLQLEREALNTVEYFRNGEIAVITLTRKMVKESGAADEDTDGIASIPRCIEGVHVGVTIKEKADDLVKVSLRAPQPYNASEICAKFGGGGHPGAAGCAIHCGVEEAKKQLVAAISQYLEEI